MLEFRAIRLTKKAGGVAIAPGLPQHPNEVTPMPRSHHTFRRREIATLTLYNKHTKRHYVVKLVRIRRARS